MRSKESAEPEAGRQALLTDELRRLDPDRYLAALFAPAEEREAVIALLLLNQELARIPDVTSQAMTGLIRYQWWREAIQEAAAGSPRQHPLVLALATAFARGRLDPDALLALVDARESEIEALPPGDLGALESYAAATGGAVQALVARILDGPETGVAAPARLVGTAFALIGILRALGVEAAQRLPVPGSTDGEGAAAALRPMARAILARATALLQEAHASAGRPPRRAMAALLPALIAKRHARDLARTDGDPLRAGRLERPASMPLLLLLAFLRRRI